jgi:hypothetical protein
MLLYPPRILGYSTKEKIWGQFCVDNTEAAAPPSETLFKDNLQLDEEYKSMIEALVKEHGANRDDSDNVEVKDFIKNKGRGLVQSGRAIIRHVRLHSAVSRILPLLLPTHINF